MTARKRKIIHRRRHRRTSSPFIVITADGAKGYKVEYALMTGEDHPTAALVSVGRGLRFAFGGARYKFDK